MPGYDPKRPRRDLDEDASAPVDALLETGAADAADSVGASPEPHRVAVVDAPDAEEAVVDLTVSSPTSPSARSETPTAPAPDTGTANPAVVAAGLAGLVAVAVLLVVWLRRRR